MLQGIKNIIFDLGGVIYAINYKTTIKAFQALGINDFDSLFAKAGQSSLFDDLETGRISKDEFLLKLQAYLPKEVTNAQIIDAWNAMLIGFMPDALECIKQLKHKYRLFLLSNTNAFHIEKITSKEGLVLFEQFCALFEKVYLSHEIGMRKPHTEVFHHIVEAQKLSASETLFIDDSPQHVEGALEAGLKAYYLKDGEQILSLFREDLV